MGKELEEIIRINRRKDLEVTKAENGLRVLKNRSSVKSFMGSKKAIRKLEMELKRKAKGRW